MAYNQNKSRRNNEEDQLNYFGSYTGSKPSCTLGHNLDFSGFAVLIEEIYSLCAVEDRRFRRQLPFAIYQHAMVEVLNAYLMHKQNFALHAIDAIYIPEPVYEYICRIGQAITPGGSVVEVNQPYAAILQGPIEQEVAVNCVYAECPSGTFGRPTAANHNVYECYWSPYVTRKLVERTLACNSDDDVVENKWSHWNPFPNNWLPPPHLVNENLLGYHIPERLSSEGIRNLAKCSFANNDTVTGLLAHSPYCMDLTSQVLLRNRTIKVVPADFKLKKTNPAIFIFQRRTEEVQCRLANHLAAKYSPFPFDATASNMAAYFAYKRERTKQAPGIFCSISDAATYDDWLAQINANFNMEGDFKPRNMLQNRLLLREDDYEELELDQSATVNCHIWLSKVFKKKQAVVLDSDSDSDDYDYLQL